MEPEQPLTLPITQPAEDAGLTQSQDVPSSQSLTPWGILVGEKYISGQLVMTSNEYSVGRAETCNFCISRDSIKENWWNATSKIHFKITRKVTADTVLVYLEDLSYNGTFVNRTRVGRGNKVILENNDVIAIAQPKGIAFVFMSSCHYEGSHLPSQLRNKYVVSKVLGKGACGEVRLVFNKSNFKKYAMKIIVKRVANPLTDPQKIINEVQIMKSLRHPCIVQMEDIIDTPTSMYIVMELMEGGELLDRILQRNGLPEKEAKVLFYQIVLAVDYLHQRGITHRDLKPENILLVSNANVTRVKISDFGLSKLVHGETVMQTLCGTPMYVAPEILLTTKRSAYTSQVDVWSLGVILYCSLGNMTPFNANNKELSLEQQIVSGCVRFPERRFASVSPRAIDLIKRMLTVDPVKRIRVREIRRHPWLFDQEMLQTVARLLQLEVDENVEPLAPPLPTGSRRPRQAATPDVLMKRARIE